MAAMDSRRATIVDVARAAGVSKSLVSLAFHGGGRIAEDTRQRILAVADQLGYRRNAVARSLVRGRTGLLAVIVTDFGNPYHADLARHIEAAADQVQVTAITLNGRRDPRRLTELLDLALQLQVDALVVSSSWIPAEAISAAARAKPLAVIARLPADAVDRGGLGFDTVHNDDERGTAKALEHLRTLGHRRIGFLAASSRPAQLARREGYRAAMRAAGSGRFIEEFSAGRPRDAVAGLIERLRAADPPTAVFASNDEVAIEFLSAAADAGIDVPGDVSVVGYDNTTLAQRWRPGLTSISQPLEQMAARAVSLVASRMGGRGDDLHEVLMGELVVRGTTARPRHDASR
ncbi:MAG TPA: LacI family DNA-binding transcriptional regulator [Micromonosporaceae bacterium]|nr:LacI family DNA-binding transcriptional regulator [Micromonosporaceae bacterium]